MQRFLKYVLRQAWRTALLLILGIAGLNIWMAQRSRDRVFTAAAALPETPVVLVLGTSKQMAAGQTNLHWSGRMDAAAGLYKAGKVRHFLVSGDNRVRDYNEPRDMRDALIERGVPAAKITMDFAGLRTLDSVIRAREIFGVQKCVIVTDDFHLPRALWLADRRGMDVCGFYGPAISWKQSVKSRTREWLARIKAAAEEWVLQRGAKFHGEKIPLPADVREDACVSANP